MHRLIIYCEGEAEEKFVNDILYDYLLDEGIYVTPIIFATKRTPTKKFKGGGLSYDRIKNELTRLCKNDTTATVTTMIDYYALPSNVPGIVTATGDAFDKVRHIEKAIEDDIRVPNLFVNLLLHEYESLLFSDTSAFKVIPTGSPEIIVKLQAIKENFASPEHINNSVETAPSKRIEALIPIYKKPLYGVTIAKQIGLNAIASQCTHFNNWLSKISSIRST